MDRKNGERYGNTPAQCARASPARLSAVPPEQRTFFKGTLPFAVEVIRGGAAQNLHAHSDGPFVKDQGRRNGK
jgi:hypothetical protein